MGYMQKPSNIYIYIYTVGEISIQHLNNFFIKHISSAAIHMQFWPDVGINSSNLHREKILNITIHKKKLCVIKWNDTGKKYWTH